MLPKLKKPLKTRRDLVNEVRRLIKLHEYRIQFGNDASLCFTLQWNSDTTVDIRTSDLEFLDTSRFLSTPNGRRRFLAKLNGGFCEVIADFELRIKEACDFSNILAKAEKKKTKSKDRSFVAGFFEDVLQNAEKNGARTKRRHGTLIRIWRAPFPCEKAER